MPLQVRRSVSKHVLTIFFFLSCSTYIFADEFIVKLSKNQTFQSSFTALSSNKETKIIDQHELGNLVLIDFIEDGQVSSKKIQALQKSINAEYIVPNIKIHTFNDFPNDPSYEKQWALEKIEAAKAWGIQRGNSAITVAVIDTGIDWEHEDLKQQIWQNPNETPSNGVDDDDNGYVDDIRGWDFFADDSDPMDETSSKNPGHGTHCAGIIGSVGDNGIGVSGIAQNVTLMPIRFLGADGSGDLMGATKSVDYAVDNGADIISASWGAAVGKQQMQPVLDAIQRANEKGILFIAAAANDGKSNDVREVYPANANFPNVISVAASGPEDEKPSWSNYGRAKVDLASPGLNILSTLPNDSYGNLSGTSMATPLVSGIAALLLSQAIEEGRSITPSEVKAILQSTGEPTEIETACQCRVSAFNALLNVTDNQLTMVPFAATLEEQEQGTLSAIGGQEPYTFKSSNEDIISITEDGLFEAKSLGQTEIYLEDALGSSQSSDRFFVGFPEKSGAECPLENPVFCEILCSYDPTLPWC